MQKYNIHTNIFLYLLIFNNMFHSFISFFMYNFEKITFVIYIVGCTDTCKINAYNYKAYNFALHEIHFCSQHFFLSIITLFVLF